MTWLFSQLLDWLVDIVGNLFAGISVNVLSLFSIDMTYFETEVPIIKDMEPILYGLGYGFALIILFAALAKNMFGLLSEEYDSPIALVGGFFISIFAIMGSHEIIQMMFDMFTAAYGFLMKIGTIDLSYPFAIPEDNAGLTGAADVAITVGSTVSGIAGTLAGLEAVVGLFLLIILTIEFFKLLVECVERYLVLCFCMVMSPLALSTFVSKGSRKIFKAYLKLTFSQLIMMLMNVIFVKAALSAMNNASDNYHSVLSVIFVVAIVETGKSIDRYMGKIGLSVADTGAGMGQAFIGGMMAFKNIVDGVPKHVGAIKGAAESYFAKAATGTGVLSGLFPSAAPLFAGLAGAEAVNNATKKAEADTLARGINESNVEGSQVADLSDGKKIDGKGFDDVYRAMNNNPNGGESYTDLFKKANPSQGNGQSAFEKIPALNNAQFDRFGAGYAHASLPDGTGMTIRSVNSLRNNERVPENATKFQNANGSTWFATPDSQSHAPINTNADLSKGSFSEMFGGQAETMANACGCSVNDSVVKAGDGIYRTSNGKTLVSDSFGGHSTIGGKKISGPNMMDGYSVFGDEDISQTPFAMDGYASSTGIASDYINRQSEGGSFYNAMSSLGQREMNFSVTSISHGGDGDMPGTFSFKTNTGGDFTAVPVSSYDALNERSAPIMDFNGNKYFVSKSSNLSNFKPRGINLGNSIDGNTYSEDAILPNGGIYHNETLMGDTKGFDK